MRIQVRCRTTICTRTGPSRLSDTTMTAWVAWIAPSSLLAPSETGFSGSSKEGIVAVNVGMMVVVGDGNNTSAMGGAVSFGSSADRKAVTFEIPQIKKDPIKRTTKTPITISRVIKPFLEFAGLLGWRNRWETGWEGLSLKRACSPSAKRKSSSSGSRLKKLA